MARYRWAFTPWWIALHLFVILSVLGMIRAAFWQYSRLMERRADNAQIIDRGADAPVPVGQLLTMQSTSDQVAEVIHRRVSIEGTYRIDDQVLIRNRSNDTAPGFWVITPLVQADGQAVAVNRGWIPLILGDQGNAASYAPPTGPVSVVGQVLQPELQEGIGAPDPAGGKLGVLSRVDVPRLQHQVSEPLYPAYIELVSQSPPQQLLTTGVAMPDPVAPPVLDDGPHLNYTGQWIIYATLTCIVYPLVLRRTARNKEKAARAAAEDAAGVAAGEPRSGPLVDKDGRVAIDVDEQPVDSGVANVGP